MDYLIKWLDFRHTISLLVFFVLRSLIFISFCDAKVLICRDIMNLETSVMIAVISLTKANCSISDVETKSDVTIP